jgi:hypothetical protein
MDVFLIPVGHARYEPYCEVPEHDPDELAGDTREGWLAGWRRKFKQLLQAAEKERDEARGRAAPAEASEEVPETRTARMRKAVLRWTAGRIAEQRLLWHLRKQTEARLIHPADLPPDEARRALRRALHRDADRHLRWLVLDSLLLVASAALAILPGPNVIAYYFVFRVVGHYLSLRGARQGLHRVKWTLQQSEPLAELRGAMTLDPPQRERALVEIESQLRLQRLARFFERVAVQGA